MTQITISSKDAERIARSFNDLIGSKGLDRIRRRAVNTVGSKLRKETRSLAGIVFGTSAAALSVQGKAAAPGSANPAYRLRMAHKIPIAKLKVRAPQSHLPGWQEVPDHRHAEPVQRSSFGRSGVKVHDSSCNVPGRCPSVDSAAYSPMQKRHSLEMVISELLFQLRRASRTRLTRSGRSGDPRPPG